VFKCVPTDNVETFIQMVTYQTEHPLAAADPFAARTMLKDVKVQLSFLQDLFRCSCAAFNMFAGAFG
jgi:hypothetical protein